MGGLDVELGGERISSDLKPLPVIDLVTVPLKVATGLGREVLAVAALKSNLEHTRERGVSKRGVVVRGADFQAVAHPVTMSFELNGLPRPDSVTGFDASVLLDAEDLAVACLERELHLETGWLTCWG